MSSGSNAGASSQGSRAAKGLDIQNTKAPRGPVPSAKLPSALGELHSLISLSI